MDGGAWWAAVHGVAQSQTQLSDFTFTFHFHALEKEMATHSNVLAWRIPGTGVPGGLPSMGSHRVEHDWSDLAAAGQRSCLKAKPMISCLYFPNSLILFLSTKSQLLFWDPDLISYFVPSHFITFQILSLALRTSVIRKGFGWSPSLTLMSPVAYGGDSISIASVFLCLEQPLPHTHTQTHTSFFQREWKHREIRQARFWQVRYSFLPS